MTFRPSPFGGDDPNAMFAGIGNNVPAGWLADNSVSSDVIAASAVTAGKIAANAVTAGTVAAGTITANELAANAVTAGKIAANAVTAGTIAADAVTANEIAAGSVTASEIAAGAVTTGKVAAGTITATEIAANAVTTAKILAGNVTTGKIELTLSGKNYGANAVNGSAPGVFFDAASTTGMGYDATAGELWVGKSLTIADVGASWQGALFFGTDVTVGRNLLPVADNTNNLGSSTQRWGTVYAFNSTINTSDESLKDEIADERLGLTFIRSLRPVTYIWRKTNDTRAVEKAEFALDRVAFAQEVAPHHRRIQRLRALQRGGRLTDADAEARVVVERKALDEIESRHFSPIHEAKNRTRRGRRQHHGLIAQDVKKALDSAGVDAAFWQQSPDGLQSLAYSELIAPLIKAVQELTERVETLEAQYGEGKR